MAVLFQIERKDIHTKPSKPFDNRLEDESWAQYKGYWKILMCIWQRMEDQNDDKKPPYKLTVRQGKLWDSFETAAEDTVVGLACQKGLDDEKMERLCLDMLVGILDYQFK